MIIRIEEIGFNQAKALLSDTIFMLEIDPSSPRELQLFKLLKARQENPDFELGISEFVCGEQNNSFPYRSSYFLSKFFNDLGYEYSHDGSTRRFWVKDVLLQMSIIDLSIIIEKGLFNKRDFKKEAKDKGIDYEINYQNSIKEFKKFIDESLTINRGPDLSYLLDFNINAELLFEKEILTEDEELDRLIKEAKERFFNPNDKQIAIEKLWDAFERIKTYYDSNKKVSSKKLLSIISEDFNTEIFEDEFHRLTKIGNDFRIRHHETDKQEITNSLHLNYLFFRMLSLLDLCVTNIQSKKLI